MNESETTGTPERMEKIIRFVARQPRLGQDGVVIKKMLDFDEAGLSLPWGEFTTIMKALVSSGLMATRERRVGGNRLAMCYYLTNCGWQEFQKPPGGKHQPQTSSRRHRVGRKGHGGRSNNKVAACCR